MIPAEILTAVAERMRTMSDISDETLIDISDETLIETMALAALTLKARGWGT